MNTKKLTLKDVADKIGVSTATISNAFNRPDQLSAKKREEILAACKEIGYDGPNKAAQSLRKGQTNIIALVLADSIEYIVSDPVASTFIKGVSAELQKHNKHLLLYAGDAKTIRDISDFVDGFICYGAPENDKLGKELKRVAKPVVTADFNIVDRPSVNIDNEQAAYDMASRAIEKGDRVAILGLRLIDSHTTCRIYAEPLFDVERSVSHRRLDGYLRAIKDKGMTISNDSIWHIPQSGGQYSAQAAKEVLTSHPLPDTIICMSDLIALEVLQLASRMNIRVPDTLKITGFDGIDEVKRTHPNLATVSQSSEQKGALAARMLLNQDTQSHILPYEISVGETLR